MNKKVIWIVNEYNFPDAQNSRQTNLCYLLNQKGYDCYIISGSAENKKVDNRLGKNEKLRYVETEEAKGYLIKTSNYTNSYERVFVSLQFQHRLWNLRNVIPSPNVIISEFAGIFGNVFLKWKKEYGTIIIFDILDLWPEGFVEMGYLHKNSLITKYLYYQEHRSYKYADGIIFSMQGGRDYIIDKGWSTEVGGDVDTSNIGYLNNGVNLNTVDRQSVEYTLDDSDLDSNKFKSVYLGSISAFNGVDILVETAKVLQENKINDVIILVYGYGNQEERLKKLAKKYNLKNIKFKGEIDKRYAMNILTRCDLNLFTFKKTSLLQYGVSPSKLFMYFASGKPVLSMIKPKYDLVEDRKAGISIDYDPYLVAETIMRFRNMDKTEYRSFCTNSRIIAEEYDYKNLVNVLVDFIERNGENAI